MTVPRVSIIVATFNAAHTLERCLTSIREQTFASRELLVVDGGSTDTTLDIIRRHHDAIGYWHSRPDRGIYDAWNQAMANARGEYVCFLGADDAWSDPGALESIFSAIGSREFDLVTSRATLRDTNWRAKGVVGAAWNYRRMPVRMGIVHPGLLHRRELFDLHGPFDPSYRIVGDLDFLMRLPADVRTLDLPFVAVDVQEAGISRRQFWQRLRERRRVHMRSSRVGPVRAWLYWLDKAWRMPIARLFGLPH